MAIEQQTPDIPFPQQIELGPPTETELCTRGAVKLTHIQLSELKTQTRTLSAELGEERARRENLSTRTNTAETELRVLEEFLYLREKRDLIIRLGELVLIVLIEFIIEAAKSGEWKRLAVLCVASLVQLALIALIQWGPRKSTKQRKTEKA